MTLQILTPPAEEPVSLAEAKAFLRVTHDAEDALIGRLIAAARAVIEAELGLALVTTAFTETLDTWALTRTGAARLSRGPLLSVEEIRIDGEAIDGFTARFATRPGLVDGRLPNPQTVHGGIEIDFTAGFGAAEDVPAPLCQALLVLVSHAFDHREGDAPLTLAEPWLAPFRRVRL
jgi:uncharacterized phiE125 gp8 family phage protein